MESLPADITSPSPMVKVEQEEEEEEEEEEERGHHVTYSINIIPCDIIEDVLSRLDAESLMQCKRVSKSWLSLIRHPSFINLHLKRQQPCMALFRHSGDEYRCVLSREVIFSFHSLENFDELSTHRFPTTFKKASRSLILMGSHNGVICLSGQVHIYLFNPAIKVLRTLPPPPPPLTPFQWDDNSFSQLGFGYDSLTNDFKVVKVCGAYDTGIRCGYSNLFKRCAQVGVYSVGSNSWKTMEMPNLFTSELDSVDSSSFDVVANPSLTCSVVVHNSIHWMLRFHPSKELNHYSFGIVAFDLNTDDPTSEGTANSTLTSE
ncbi:F-box domain containing protein [Trema orientale]|uniref:F-box domain containing protein n=1 Tax=Trema orientale TaxID=63057 RepID=A0A2P5FDB3_TREOI|nr:F-box domain containing protein [Trema orientale]